MYVLCADVAENAVSPRGLDQYLRDRVKFFSEQYNIDVSFFYCREAENELRGGGFGGMMNSIDPVNRRTSSSDLSNLNNQQQQRLCNVCCRRDVSALKSEKSERATEREREREDRCVERFENRASGFSL